MDRPGLVVLTVGVGLWNLNKIAAMHIRFNACTDPCLQEQGFFTETGCVVFDKRV